MARQQQGKTMARRDDGKTRQQQDNSKTTARQDNNKLTARQGLVNVSSLMYCNTELALVHQSLAGYMFGFSLGFRNVLSLQEA